MDNSLKPTRIQKIQGINRTYNQIKTELIDYIEYKIQEWNDDIAYSDDEKIKLVAVELYGSRLRNQARDISDLDCVFEYSAENVNEDDLFNFINEDEYTINGIRVDFNPINKNKSGDMETYMKKSNDYDYEKSTSVKEALKTLTEAGYIVEDFKSKLGKVATIGALAASSVFGNTGINQNKVGPNDVPGDKVGFGKTAVHLQHRYNYPSDKRGVPTSYKLPDNEKKFDISYNDEMELTKKKILATPDTILRQYGKKNVDKLANLFIKAATKYNLDIDVLLAIAATETGFDNNRTSNKNAVGIMQMTSIAAKDVHTRLLKKDLSKYDFSTFSKLEDNIDNSARLVADLSKRRKNVLEMIFATYNGGTEQATAWRYTQLGRKITTDGNRAPQLTTETKNYVQRCLKYYKLFKQVQNEYLS